ncbi:hypothetical protein [Burkholderia cenocepacia]|uniref:hypothetical protein n=1 Tax=Burkholderia cenocepacia TaxID=95486 RepID=UPI000B2791F8|nr:hypothetical protein [Burkholderia cenocepacia]
MSEIRSISVLVKQAAEQFAPNLKLNVQGAPVEREDNSQLYTFARVTDDGEILNDAVHVLAHESGELDVHVQPNVPQLAARYQTHLSQYLPEAFAFG